MTDRTAAARPGGPGSSSTGTAGCGMAWPLDGPVPEDVGLPSAIAWCPGRRAPPSRLPSLSKRPGSPSLVSVFPRSRYRITTGYTRDKHSAHLSSIAARRVDNFDFLRMHRHGWCFPQVKGSVMGAARPRNPQLFHRTRTGSTPLRTSHPHLCAQPAGKQSSCCTGGQPINAPVPV